MNSGHNRATAQVIRTAGEDHEPRIFRTWAAKAIALIGSLPGTLEDRAIVIPMRRRRAMEKVERFRGDRDHGLPDLARKCARWADDHAEALAVADPAVPEELHDRDQDNWRPLIAIADEAGGPWPDWARKAARELSSVEAETSDGVLLLSDLREVVRWHPDPKIASKTLVEALIAMDDRPWAEWGRGDKPLTTNGLARLLRPFGCRPQKLRFETTTAQGYETAVFKDAFSRYLPDSPEPTGTLEHLNDFEGLAEDSTGTQTEDVPVVEPEELNENGQRSGVPVAEPDEKPLAEANPPTMQVILPARERQLPLDPVSGIELWICEGPGVQRRWQLRRDDAVLAETEVEDHARARTWIADLRAGLAPKITVGSG